jgi:hypothetical protein
MPSSREIKRLLAELNTTFVQNRNGKIFKIKTDIKLQARRKKIYGRSRQRWS